MSVIAEALEEFLGGFMNHSVKGDLVYPIFQLGGGGKFAMNYQVGDFQKIAFVRELLDGVSAIAQDALVPIDVGNCALTSGGVHECGVVGHQPKIFAACFDLT